MILFVEDILKIDEKLYFFTRDVNTFFSLNIDNGNLEFLGGMPEEEIFARELTCKLVNWKRKIIIIPKLAKKIWIYSLGDKSWEGLEIDIRKDGGGRSYFRQAVLYKDFLFLIGGHYPSILKVDLNSYAMTYIEEPFINCKKRNESDKELYFRGDFVQKENILYLASCRDNSILIFDLDTLTYEWCKVGIQENRYAGIMWDGKYFWLAPRKNTSIVKWDGNKEITEFAIPTEKKADVITYSGILKKDNQIIIPALAGCNVDTIVLTSEGVMEFYDERFTFYKRDENGGYLAQKSDGKVIFTNSKGEQREFEGKLSIDRFYDLLRTSNFNIDEIVKYKIYENNPFSLCEMLKLLEKIKNRPMAPERDGGYDIWNTIIG